MTASDYFQSCQGYFWVWEREGSERVLSIPHDMTIAYKPTLEVVLDTLALQGLPPFGSLLLLMIATNPQGNTSVDTVYSIVSTALETTDDLMLSKAISFLKLVTEVPEQYKKGSRRIVLLQTLLERCHNVISQQESKTFSRSFATMGSEGVAIGAPPAEFDRSQFETDFRTISLLANKFDTVDSIVERMAAVPDASQQEIDFEATPQAEALVAVDFVDELIDNTKTFHVGSLIRSLWAGINIPVHSTIPSQQPLGGYSDITNKGDYARLLVSEFANEDLIFLSRLANNEALYVHREIPPADHRLHRIFLIDTSLKNWGTPKILAYSIALAIASHPKTDIPCSVFALDADGYREVKVDDIHSLIDALQLVNGSLHAASSLESFLRTRERDNNTELIFITEESTFKYPELIDVVKRYARQIHYLFFTDATGGIDIHRNQSTGRRHLQHLHLDLKKHWNRSPGQKPVVSAQEGQLVHYPILIRPSGHNNRILSLPDESVLCISAEGNVLRNTTTLGRLPRGWEVIYENLPFKPEFCEAGIGRGGEAILLLFRRQDSQLAVIDLSTGETKRGHFQEWNSRSPGFIFHIDSFFHQGVGNVLKIAQNLDVSPLSDQAWNAINGPMSLADKLHERTKHFETVARAFKSQHTTLKNIQSVYVNDRGQLGLNKCVLTLDAKGTWLNWDPLGSRVSKVRASQAESQHFQFDEGSTVHVHRDGFIILRSGKPNSPYVYIPTAIQTSLGVATSADFAGRDFYWPGLIGSYWPHVLSPEELAKNEPRPHPLMRAPLAEFYNKYIASFIESVVRHGV